METIIEILARELGRDQKHVENVAALLDEGNTIPFIARYRKEATGGLDDGQLRTLEARLDYLQRLEARKQEVAAAVEEAGALTAQLRQALAQATTLQRVEDLYKPFKKTRATRASKARDAGLGPLAAQMRAQGAPPCDPLAVAARFARDGGALAGFDMVTCSDVPPGCGLSSSAAFEVMLGAALEGLSRCVTSDEAVTDEVLANLRFQSLMDKYEALS